MATQAQFNFESNLPKDGLTSWHSQREQASRALALKLGLPIGHPVEVRLKDGVVLRGTLRAGEVLFDLENFSRGKVALQVERVVFSCSEIESCVRLD